MCETERERERGRDKTYICLVTSGGQTEKRRIRNRDNKREREKSDPT